MNAKGIKPLYFSYEEAGLKNPLFVPSFISDKLNVDDPDFLDRKYFTNVFRDNPEYFIIKNHIKKLKDYFYCQDFGIDNFRISKICLKTDTENKFKVIYVVSGTAPNYIYGPMICPIDNGTNNDCLIIHKDILRSVLKNINTYTHYADPLCWAKNLFTFLYGEDFLKEGRKYKNYNFMKMTLLVSLYGIYLHKIIFREALAYIINKYSLNISNPLDQNHEENKNDLIALRSLLALLIDSDNYIEDFIRSNTIFDILNSLQTPELKNFSFEDMNDLVDNKLDILNFRNRYEERALCEKECNFEKRLIGLIDNRINEFFEERGIK